jgi:NTP pyrophosphatase (non-canonical NTP hydrolase)
MLTFEEFSKANEARKKQFFKDATAEWSIADAFMAMIGELGETANALKKVRRAELGMLNKNAEGRQINSLDDAKKQIAGEIGGFMCYLDQLCVQLGLRLEDCIVDEFNKKSAELGLPERIIQGNFRLTEANCPSAEQKPSYGPDPVTGVWIGAYVRINTRVLVKARRLPAIVVQHDSAWNNFVRYDNGAVEWAGRAPELEKADGSGPLTEEDLTTVKGAERLTSGKWYHEVSGGYDPYKELAETLYKRAGNPEATKIAESDDELFVSIATQNAEFDALDALVKVRDVLYKVPVVDDDYPHHRGHYESAMMGFLRALKANGRTTPPWS